MRDRIIIDTSVWIEYLQGSAPEPLSAFVDECMSFYDIYVPKIVIAELMQGAHSEKDIAVIVAYFDAFKIIGEKENTWSEAGRLSYNLKKKGRTVNLADCYIAIMALENKCSVLTLDKHFRDIHRETGLILATY